MIRIVLTLLKVLTIGALALLVLAGAVRFFGVAVDASRSPAIGELVDVRVSEDQPTAELAKQLADAGLIKSQTLFQGQLRLLGGELVPGTYTLRKGMSQSQIIDRITGETVATVEPVAAGSNASQSFSITVPEGWRIEQIAEEYERLGGAGGFDGFMQAVANVDRSQYDFLASLPPEISLEGYLFPDTYTFSSTDPNIDVATMLQNFGQKFDSNMRTRSKEMGLSIHEVVTFASLVEKEAVLPEERPIIADVYLSRWDEGWRLDADPTVQYVLGTSGDWWPTLSGDDLFVDSPYNTYQNDGLPPGPIANPGFGSLQAVLTPEETDYMYFVAKCDTGEHAFAATKDEQDANVEKYQNQKDCS
ncbi:MAG: endolytic transglycosylase MltG [Thermomicrobiales bacterium]|nr:endolytic transglycosylase MltG [Thermomicrobiales bacterium]